MTIRTILVDDEPLAIQGLQLRLQAHEDVEVIDTCSNGREAIRAHTRERAAPLQQLAGPAFEAFLDLVGRPARRVVLPSR